MRARKTAKDLEDFPVRLAWAAAEGACAGALVALALVWLNIGNLGTLLRASPDGDLLFFLLIGAFASSLSMVGVVKLVLGLSSKSED